MLGVKESFKARNGNRGNRESRRRESSRARNLSSSRSLKTLRKVWARVCARAGVCARAPYSQSPADMTSGMELLLEHTCGAEPLNQRRKKTPKNSADLWIWRWGLFVKMSDKSIHHKSSLSYRVQHQFRCSSHLFMKKISFSSVLSIKCGLNIIHK